MEALRISGIPFVPFNRENRAPPTALISIHQRWSDLRRRRGAPVALPVGPGVLV